MGNTILTPSIIAKEALMVLRNNAVMANLVHRDYSADFTGAVGDTITIRKPASFIANEFDRTAGLTVQTATESSTTIKLDKLLDVSFEVTAEEMTLDIADFSTQLLVPAMQAFADKIDKYIIELGASVTNRVTQTEDAKADLIAARTYLTKSAAPLTERRYVYNSDIEAALLNTNLFVSAEQVGDEGTALREASLGRKFGLDCYVDQNFDASSYTTGDTLGLEFNKNAFALVTRTLALPQGASNASIQSYDGYGLRVVYGYDMDKKKDIISIDMLCGVKLLDANLAAAIQHA